MIGILFVGVQIDKQYALIREKMLACKLGDSGRFFVLNGAPVAAQGKYLCDKAREGQLPCWEASVQQALLNQPQGILQTEINGESKLIA
nr:methyl-accepting chemotaxis protein [Candidatus Pantoea persica]